MSKRDRANRFADSPDFQELSPIGNEQIGKERTAETTALSAPQSKSIPVIVESPEENEKGSFLGKIGTFFASSWKKMVAISATVTKAVFSKPWTWCRSCAQWTWQFLRKIPSYCVIRWDSKETDDEQSETFADSKNSTKDNTKPISKIDPPKTEIKSADPKPVRTASAVEEYDEEEVVGSRWWSIGIKTAAATAALLVLGGGYFVIKPMLFPVTTSDMEILAVTDQTPPEGAKEPAQETNTVAAAASVTPPAETPAPKIPEPASVLAEASPSIADAAPVAETTPAFPEPPAQSEEPALQAQTELEPSQGSLLSDDLFAAAPAPAAVESAVAEKVADNAAADNAVLPAVSDPFGAAPLDTFAEPTAAMPAETAPAVIQSSPLNDTKDITAPTNTKTAAKNAVSENTSAKPLSALAPLVPLETTQSASPQPQLQPLVALDSSVPMAATPTAAAPAAVPSAAGAPIASNFRDRRNARRTNTNPSFDQAPSPPSVVSTIPETAAPTTMLKKEAPIADPVKEIIPQIPQTGTVEEIPPPVVPQNTESPAIEPTSAQIQTAESAPAIPKGDPPKTENVVTVPPAPESAAIDESVLPFLPINESPIDQSLRERLRGQRNDEETEPAQLRFTTQAATQEPALRFTPKKEATPAAAPVTSPSVNEKHLLMSESVDQFRGLLPDNQADSLSPNSDDIVIALPALENAPAPVFAEIKPAYREGQQGTSEKGRTFQSRIDSEIKRSPTATETYVIQQGDTYMTISDRFYGTSLLYTALAAHNQKSGIGWRPAEGVVIEIPTAEYLQANYGDATKRQERRLAAQRSAIRYIVQEGDTIFRLATDKLQDSTRWREIYALNTDRIKDVRVLQPGMEILLPAETVQ